MVPWAQWLACRMRQRGGSRTVGRQIRGGAEPAGLGAWRGSSWRRRLAPRFEVRHVSAKWGGESPDWTCLRSHPPGRSAYAPLLASSTPQVPRRLDASTPFVESPSPAVADRFIYDI